MKKQILVLLILLCVICINAESQYSKLFEFSLDNDLSGSFFTPVFDGEYLYGTSAQGGSHNKGAIFKVKPDGTGYIKLLDFDEINGEYPRGPLSIAGNTLYGITIGNFSGRGSFLYRINTDGSGFGKLREFRSNLEGAELTNSLVISDSIIYGMTLFGGTMNNGYIFKINTDGSGFAKLLNFNGENGGHPYYNSLVISGNELYGITRSGGANNLGCIFKLNIDGSGYCKLLDFCGSSNGQWPRGSLILSGNVLYGTTSQGGINNMGCIFKISTDGNEYSKLLDFSGTINGNSPRGSLTLSGGELYGMTENGGLNNMGCIFKIKTNGSEFTKLLDFNTENVFYPDDGTLMVLNNELYGASGGGRRLSCLFKINTNGSGFSKLLISFGAKNGSYPFGSLTISDGVAYGMTGEGGTNERGCIFKINTKGNRFTKLFDFNGSENGSMPVGSLTLWNGKLYGTTKFGGLNGMGCMFKIDTNGTGYTKLLDFNGEANGQNPGGSLTICGNKLYGMTSGGGLYGNGCIFNINSDGSAYSKLLDFNYLKTGSGLFRSLIMSDSILYGTSGRGLNGKGCIFKINPNGSGYSNLYEFDGTTNGADPRGLAISGNELYGMTYGGGLYEKGCIFKININGSGYSKLLDFDDSTGGYPEGSLLLLNNELYGMTSSRGENIMACIFKINTDGSEYNKILDFNGIENGNRLYGSLTQSNNVIYGMTSAGGADDLGIVFKYAFSPSIQAQNITFSYITSNKAEISWSKGNGARRTVFVKMGTGAILDPEDSITYTASADWSSQGTQLVNSGYYCVYNDTGNTVVITNLSPITQYTVQIYEYNGDSGSEQYLTNTEGNNPASFSTLKLNQTITFGPIQSKTYGDADFILAATASSGLEVTYIVTDTNIATIDGNKIAIVGAGITDITAYQTGNDYYNSAIPVIQQLIVVPVTGIDGISSRKILIYPNPTQGNLFIQSDLVIKNAYVSNIQGKKLKHYHLDSNSATIDLGQFSSGIYIIRIQCGKFEYSQKIEIE